MVRIVPVEFDGAKIPHGQAGLQSMLEKFVSWGPEKVRSGCADMNITAFADARGLRCPYPVSRMRKVLHRMNQGERLLLLTDDPLAKTDVQFALQLAGNKCIETASFPKFDGFLIEK